MELEKELADLKENWEKDKQIALEIEQHKKTFKAEYNLLAERQIRESLEIKEKLSNVKDRLKVQEIVIFELSNNRIKNY